jgi:hypothetical protein
VRGCIGAQIARVAVAPPSNLRRLASHTVADCFTVAANIHRECPFEGCWLPRFAGHPTRDKPGQQDLEAGTSHQEKAATVDTSSLSSAAVMQRDEIREAKSGPGFIPLLSVASSGHSLSGKGRNRGNSQSNLRRSQRAISIP